MKFWTVQKREMIDYVLNGEEYYPNFYHSDYLRETPDLSLLYYMVLNSFNMHNKGEYKGLVFSFFKLSPNEKGTNTISSFGTFESFSESIRKNKNAILGLWNHFLRNDCVILELEYDEKFNPLFIEFNDFQFLMPPIRLCPPYEMLDIQRITHGIHNAQVYDSPMSSSIVQGHSPYIKRENIVKIYDMFPLE